MRQRTNFETQKIIDKSSLLNTLNKLGKYVIENYEFLWVFGLIFLPILVCTQLFDLYTNNYQWYQYLAFGTIYPAFFLGIALAKKSFYDNNIKIIIRIKLLMLLVFVITVIVYFTIGGFYYTRSGLGFIGLASTLAYIQTFVIRKREQFRGKAKSEQKNINNLLLFIFAAIIWTVCLPFIFNQFKIGLNISLIQLLYTLAITLIILILICLEIFRKEKNQATKFRFITLGNVIAVIIIALLSFRTDNLFNPVSFHHWGVIAGSAEMVRQGGWLLWDVPSQYGFLSTLALAFLPIQNIWFSLYILNGLLNFLVGVGIFYGLRWPYNNISRFWFALTLTVTAAFFRVNIANTYGFSNLNGIEGVDVFPSSGGLRYFWCYILLLVLLFQYRSKDNMSKQSKVFLVGSLVWLIGVFWSAESAVYCSAIWLPAFVTIVMQHYLKKLFWRNNPAKLFFTILCWFFLPIILLIIMLVLLQIVYVVGLGYGPDWKSYLDYAAGTDYFILLLDQSSAIWAFLALYCFLCILGLKLLNKGITNPLLPLFLGVFGMAWTTSSYYLTREVPAALAYIKPFVVIVLIVGLFLGKGEYSQEKWFRLYRLFTTATLTMIIVSSILSPFDIKHSILNSNQDINIDQQLPSIDTNLEAIFAQAQVKPTDPIVYTGDLNLLPTWYYKDGNNQLLVTNTLTWLPIYPDALLHVLPLERRQVYIDRFINQHKLSGWLIERLSGAVPNEFKFDEPNGWLIQIDDKYTATKSFANQEWRITWYQYKN